MAITQNSFYKYEEKRAQAGYKSSLLVKQQNETKYTLLIASETVPSIFGSQESFDFDLLQQSTKGKVAGKISLDDKEFDVLHTRDNVYRLEKYKNKALDFLTIDSQFVGYKFTGTLAYRVNDASNDILRGTITITPMSADETPILNCRNLILEPLYFEEVIPETVTAGDTINCKVKQLTSAKTTYTVVKIGDDGTETPATTDVTVSGEKITFTATASGLYTITASETVEREETVNYAPWTTTVYVEAKTA